MNQTAKISPWIQSPWADLSLFAYSWVPVFLIFFILDHAAHGFQSRNLVILVILLFNFLHRHITFPLVYGDPDIFKVRKKSYITLPIFFSVLTLVALYQKSFLNFLVILSVMWTIFHTLMQKMGILRFYSRKAGYGIPWIDKALVFSWFFTVLFLMGSAPHVRQRVAGYASAGRFLNSVFNSIDFILPTLTAVAMMVAVAVTILFLREEWKNRGRFHLPRNLYVTSILLLFVTFKYDLLVGYAVFGFSHAVEYLAFVNIYARKKYGGQENSKSLMARWVRRQALSMAIFSVILLSIFFYWRSISLTTLNIYIVGSSFLHFLYDGWIWKVRRPEVGRPLGIQYAG